MIAGKVLVVDDERTTRRVICEALSLSGKQASPASSGSEAIALLSADKYDVVILDLNMPHQGGMAVLKVADELAPETLFIILTAHASTDSAIEALRSGVFDYLVKPTPLHLIIETVDKALLRQQQQKQQKRAIQMLEQALEGLRPSAVNANSEGERPSLDSASLDEERPLPPYLTCDGVTIDTQQQTVTYQGKQLKLTLVEYKLLCRFVQQPNTIIAYTSLAQTSHQMSLDETEAWLLLRTHLFRLSRKLGDKAASPLQNIHSRGYILYADSESGHKSSPR